MNLIRESAQKVLGNKVPKNLGLVERCVLMEKIISISEICFGIYRSWIKRKMIYFA